MRGTCSAQSPLTRLAALATLVSGLEPRWFVLSGAQRGGRWPPAPSRGGWRPSTLRPQPWESPGTTARVTYDRTVARRPIARTREVTVAKTFVEWTCPRRWKPVSGRAGVRATLPSTPEGIAALAAFCKVHGVELVAMEASGGCEKRPFPSLGRGHPCALQSPGRQAVRRRHGASREDRPDRCRGHRRVRPGKRIVPCEPASAAQEQLKALVIRLRQLTDLRTAQANQRRLVSDPTCSGSSRR